jgi:NAD(P)-dependent dehydrogenase (short-subunit alcohol dehydrogenase family)
LKSHQSFDLTDRVIIITGAAGLIGKEYVKALSNVGAKVIAADIDSEKIRAFAESGDHGSVLDISQPDSILNMIDEVMKKYGRIDGLVNNAAIDPKFDPAHAKEHVLNFENFPLDLWQQALDVNLTGMFLCTQAVVPVMIKQNKGIIVNVSSMYGMVGPDQRLYESDDPEATPFYKPVTYTVTKSAVFGFTKYLATYLAGKNIRVNTLTLGGVFNQHEQGFLKRYSSRTPLGRMAKADEYCGALIFLLSDASSYMTGSNLVADGGWTAW